MNEKYLLNNLFALDQHLPDLLQFSFDLYEFPLNPLSGSSVEDTCFEFRRKRKALSNLRCSWKTFAFIMMESECRTPFKWA